MENNLEDPRKVEMLIVNKVSWDVRIYIFLMTPTRLMYHFVLWVNAISDSTERYKTETQWLHDEDPTPETC
jgi:hypothetical protein